MQRKALVLTLGAVFSLGLASTPRTQPTDGRDSIEWPSREFPTLQNAIDALPDGGVLRIREGRFEIDRPLIVRNKRITVEGAGCAALPRGKSGNDRATQLAGPRPERVVPFAEVAGLFSYVAAAGGAVTGGVIRGLDLSGFDAGFRISAEAGEPSSGGGHVALTVEDTCISNTGRGIASSAPGAKLVAQNVLIKDVLWNGISISPSAFSTLVDSIFMSFGVTVVNTGQACVVVKNSLYTAFQDHYAECGFNGGLPGAGGGLIAANSGLNFIDSTIGGINGLGLAANGGTTFIQQDSFILATLGLGILLVEPLYAMIKDSHVLVTQHFPAGHPQAGQFGDGVAVAGTGTVWVGGTLIEDTDRAGIANWGSFVDVGDTMIECAAFDIEGEPYLGHNFLFHDRGGNHCGCPQPTGQCMAVSAGFSAPDPISVNE